MFRFRIQTHLLLGVLLLWMCLLLAACRTNQTEPSVNSDSQLVTPENTELETSGQAHVTNIAANATGSETNNNTTNESASLTLTPTVTGSPRQGAPDLTMTRPAPTIESHAIIYVASEGGNRIVMSAQPETQTVSVLSDPEYDSFLPKRAEQGNRLVFQTRFDYQPVEYSMIVYDFETGITESLPGVSRNPFRYDLSPDGTLLVFGDSVEAVDQFYTTYLLTIGESAPAVLARTRSRPIDYYWNPIADLILVLAESERGSPINYPYFVTTEGETFSFEASVHPFSFDWHPDGNRYAYDNSLGHLGDGSSGIYISDLEGSGERILLDSEQTLHGPEWSPDGESLAYEMSFAVFYDNLESGEHVQISTPGAIGTLPSWSPDGQYIAYLEKPDDTDDGYSLMVYSVETGVTFELISNSVQGFRPIWSP